nr:hypothetical protein BgiMline_004368 [Biomphalaria glabrata]
MITLYGRAFIYIVLLYTTTIGMIRTIYHQGQGTHHRTILSSIGTCCNKILTISAHQYKSRACTKRAMFLCSVEVPSLEVLTSLSVATREVGNLQGEKSVKSRVRETSRVFFFGGKVFPVLVTTLSSASQLDVTAFLFLVPFLALEVTFLALEVTFLALQVTFLALQVPIILFFHPNPVSAFLPWFPLVSRPGMSFFSSRGLYGATWLFKQQNIDQSRDRRFVNVL